MIYVYGYNFTVDIVDWKARILLGVRIQGDEGFWVSVLGVRGLQLSAFWGESLDLEASDYAVHGLFFRVKMVGWALA